MDEKKILVSWIGEKDIDVMRVINNGQEEERSSSLAALAENQSYKFKKIILVQNYREGEKNKEDTIKEVEEYVTFLKERSTSKNLEIISETVLLENPVDMEKLQVIGSKILIDHCETDATIYYNMSSGTWAMRWMWFFMSETGRFHGTLLQGSPEAGIKKVTVPYELSGMYLFQNQATREKEKLIHSLFEPRLEQSLVSQKLKRLIFKASRAASTDYPVFILAERGCYSDKLARGIHQSSTRGKEDKVMHSADCFYHSAENNTISEILSRSEGSTILLENIDHLSRINQEKLIERFESQNSLEFPRLIVSSTKTFEDIKNQSSLSPKFVDLVTRVVLKIPPLRDREEDLKKIINYRFDRLCKDQKSSLTLSNEAKEQLIKHQWPGNDVELEKALTQLILFTEGDTVNYYDVAETLFELPEINTTTSDMQVEISENFRLKEHLDKIAKRYIITAMSETNRNKSEAAKRLGVSSQQTLGKWIKRLGIGG